MTVLLKKEHQLLDRQTIVNLVRKWGDVNTEGLLSSTCQFFSAPLIEGFIGYRLEKGNAVVFGDPVCAPADKPILATAFQQHCRRKKIGVVYLIVSEDFSRWASLNLNAVLIEFGEKFILNPLSNPIDHTGPKAVLVRNRVKHALREGTSVQEYSGDNPDIENTLQAVATSWQKERQGPQVYLADFKVFEDRLGKRWFYAQKDTQIVGILILSQLQSTNGWLLNNVLITKDAPNGISELLVISMLQILSKEDCQSVTAGPVPAFQLGEINGLNCFSAKLARGIYKIAKHIFHLSGREAFWKKFQPETLPSYLLFPDRNLSYTSIKSLLKALNAHV